LKQAEAALKVAKKNLSFAYYKAPFTGTVTDNVVDIGSEIKSGEILGKLVNTSELEAKFFVGESKFTELGTDDELNGKQIKIRWQKSKFNKIYKAQIIRIDSVIREELAGLNMYARIDNISDNDPIRPGVFIEVILEGNPIENAIKVPENAVYEERYVYILVENNAVKVEVRVEGYIDNQLIISGDFNKGEQVILTRLDNFQKTSSYYSKNN
jgi:RND family efflux transporter MFP subunit